MTQKKRHGWLVLGVILTVICIGFWFAPQALAQGEPSLPTCPSDADVWVVHRGHYVWHSWVWFSDQEEPYQQFEDRAAKMNGYDSPQPFWSLPAGALVCIPEVAGYEYELGENLVAAAEADSLQDIITDLETDIAQLTTENEQLAEQNGVFPWWLSLVIIVLLLGFMAYRYSYYDRSLQNDLKLHKKQLESEREEFAEDLKELQRQIDIMTEDGKFSPITVSAMVEVAKHYAISKEIPEKLHRRGFVDVLQYPYPVSGSDEPWVIIPGASQPVKEKNSENHILNSDESRKAYGIISQEEEAAMQA